MHLERIRIKLVGRIVRRQGLHPLPTKTPRRAPPRAHSRRGGGRREAAGRGDPGRRLRGGGASHHDRVARHAPACRADELKPTAAVQRFSPAPSPHRSGRGFQPRRSGGTLQLSTRCSSLALPPSRSLAVRVGPARMSSPACDGAATNAIASTMASARTRAASRVDDGIGAFHDRYGTTLPRKLTNGPGIRIARTPVLAFKSMIARGTARLARGYQNQSIPCHASNLTASAGAFRPPPAHVRVGAARPNASAPRGGT